MKTHQLVVVKIINNILFIINCFLLFIVGSFAFYSKASPLPALIGLSIYWVFEIALDQILMKANKKNSILFNPKHSWKYKDLPMTIISLVVIAIYLYQLLDFN